MKYSVRTDTTKMFPFYLVWFLFRLKCSVYHSVIVGMVINYLEIIRSRFGSTAFSVDGNFDVSISNEMMIQLSSGERTI